MLESGSLDLLFRLYVTDFRDCLTRTGANRSGHDRKSSLLTACNSLLVTICHVGNDNTGNNSSKAAVMSFIERHPFYNLWSVHPAIFSSRYSEPVQYSATSSRRAKKFDLDSKRLLERREAWYAIALDSHPKRWKVGNMRWVCWRISSIYDMMADYSRASLYENGLHHVAFDAFVDLMEFIGDHKAHPSFFFPSDPPEFGVMVVVHFIHWFTRSSMYTQGLTHRRFKSLHPFFLNSGCLELIKRTIRALDELESVSIHPDRDQQDGISPNDSDQIDHNSQYRRNLLNWAITVFLNATNVDDVDDVLEIFGDDELGEETDTDVMNVPLRPIEVSDRELARLVVDPENIDELYEWIEDWC
ncbi:hypothetical protein K435DRAFT_841199 [Dendrothele bispora CBS 962.96]|uniref:Uncharacterized protein n=1 Tax=Dendrothele bispora (strain CBS 962.96) TaxID=1314807 RepID=A0A4S8LQE9_DENBC|nr:hypothetical protein K435DRAFT_841199 [Dendrothele bispora CBS 962.96]